MTLSRLLPWLLLTLFALFAAFVGQSKSAGALSLLDVQLEGPNGAVAPGGDALFLVYAVGEPAELDKLQYSVEGGSIAGVVALNETERGVSEGAVYVRRETAGEATLFVSLLGQPLTSGTARFVPHASIIVEVAASAPADAAARSWSFEVLDAANVVVTRLSVAVSGARPTASAATEPLPAGIYTIRPAASADADPACGADSLFALAGGTTVALAGEPGNVPFTLTYCAIDDVRGARSGSAPLPPATGNGSIQRSLGSPLIVAAAAALFASLLFSTASLAIAVCTHDHHHD